jgi:hypothetical protein
MRICTLLATFVAAVVLVHPRPGLAEDTAARAQAEQKLQEAKQRLALTPEQQAQLQPIFKDRNEKLAAIRASHAGDTSRKARMEMFKSAREVQQDFEAKVSPILDDRQRAEWEKMRAESKERMKEQYKARQAAD